MTSRRKELRHGVVKCISEPKCRRFFKEKENSRGWKNMNRRKKVEKIVNLSVRQSLSLKKCLASVNTRDLYSIYFRFSSRHYEKYNLTENMSDVKEKKKLVDKIVKEFLLSTNVYKKRRIIERRNIDSFFLESFNLPKFCGRFIIPMEILSLIFSYLPKDSSSIHSVGSVCRSLYLSLLSSWDELDLKGEGRAYQISLLALRNITRVDIKCGLKKKDLKFFFSENKNRCRTIIVGDTNILLMLASILKSRKNHTGSEKKNRIASFGQINELILRRSHRSDDKDKRKRNLSKVNVFEIFPNLRTIDGIKELKEFSRIKGTEKLEELTIHPSNSSFDMKDDFLNKRIIFRNVRKVCLVGLNFNELFIRTTQFAGRTPKTKKPVIPLNLHLYFPNLEELILKEFGKSCWGYDYREYVDESYMKHKVNQYGLRRYSEICEDLITFDISDLLGQVARPRDKTLRKLVITSSEEEFDFKHAKKRNAHSRFPLYYEDDAVSISPLIDLQIRDLHISTPIFDLNFVDLMNKHWVENRYRFLDPQVNRKVKIELHYLFQSSVRKKWRKSVKRRSEVLESMESLREEEAADNKELMGLIEKLKTLETLVENDHGKAIVVYLKDAIDNFTSFLLQRMKHYEEFELIINPTWNANSFHRSSYSERKYENMFRDEYFSIKYTNNNNNRSDQSNNNNQKVAVSRLEVLYKNFYFEEKKKKKKKKKKKLNIDFLEKKKGKYEDMKLPRIPLQVIQELKRKGLNNELIFYHWFVKEVKSPLFLLFLKLFLSSLHNNKKGKGGYIGELLMDNNNNKIDLLSIQFQDNNNVFTNGFFVGFMKDLEKGLTKRGYVCENLFSSSCVFVRKELI